KVEMAPYRETLEKLNSVLLQHLTDVGADRVGSSSGTVYRTEKKTAPVADKSVFWTFVTEHGNWDLIDYKANPTAVADYMKQHSAPVPGVNYTVRYEVGVRRK